MTEHSSQHSHPHPHHDGHHDSRRGFLVGAGLSLVVLVSFFVGAWADRIFVVKPVDYFAKRTCTVKNPSELPQESKLGDLLQSVKDLTVADVTEVASESVVTVSVKRQEALGGPFIINIPDKRAIYQRRNRRLRASQNLLRTQETIVMAIALITEVK